MRKDSDVYGLEECTCFVCGKTFVKPPMSVYKVRYRFNRKKAVIKTCCSWRCFREATTKMKCKSIYGEDNFGGNTVEGLSG